MKILFFLFTLITSAATGQIIYQAEESQKLIWTGKAAFTGYSPEGTLDLMSASISISDGVIQAMSVVVDMRSLDQENTQLRDHLRAADFFDVENFPVATFTLSETAPAKDGSVLLNGNMTIRGETQAEIIKVSVSMEDEVLILNFEHLMDRTRYGINYNSPSFFTRLKDQAIADDFVLKASLKYIARNNPKAP